MEDVQSHGPQIPLNIDRVGVRELRLPLLVRDRTRGTQQTVASVDLGVDLPSEFKGTHMSRFVEALEQWNDEISYQSVRRLLQDIRQRLEARRAFPRFVFPPSSARPLRLRAARRWQDTQCGLRSRNVDSLERNSS